MLSYNFYYWCVHSIIYAYCHNKCKNLYYLNPWALDWDIVVISSKTERQDIVGYFISGIPVCLGEIHVESVLDRYYLEGE